MEQYQTITIVIIFILLAGEIVWSVFDKVRSYDYKDMGVNLTLGALGVGLSVGMKVLVFVVFSFFYQYKLFDLEMNWVYWVVLLLAHDCIFYWFHRWAHEWRFIWAGHVNHHSSKEFNFSVALRLPFTQLIFRFLFFIPLAWIGFDPLSIILLNSITGMYQFFMHAKDVGKLGPIEWIMNTPSHHRVHHGTQEKYIDKNYAGILVIYDRMFGTFQKEEEQPEYGIVKDFHSYDPLKVLFHEWGDMLRDVRRSRSLREVGQSLMLVKRKTE